MDSTRKLSLGVTFILAFFILASDLHMESQAWRVDHDPYKSCHSDEDCTKIHYYCPPSKVPYCQVDRCGCGN
ncbi:hypothetical protein MtrunA17_Chr4g0018671 [Medicago truncatula]|uniref:Nodule Cysteine-Rich (NCR) secreted peptide-like protein n=1 Tax=Medicago truncatula TaxID=3880 RepID=A0A072UI64_MEDTR|nr:Nodule Cysteine-Rich (NCR) secreted peptide-like protein [Medicago truncatula]RHN59848.1 hypothetical protein MtrunA17_Chr4g0018671 [Medicago truncatula]